jgi:hypothetical protein
VRIETPGAHRLKRMQRHYRLVGLTLFLLVGVLIWWVWHERSLLALGTAILLLLAHAGWVSGDKSGYTFFVIFILLAATLFLTGISLVLAAKASSITAAVLLAIGLFSPSWAERLRDSRLTRLMRTMPGADTSKIAEATLRERGALVALESLLDREIRLVAVTLGFASGIVWLISVILRRP